MRERHRLAKRTPVREIDHHLNIRPNIVRADDDLLSVARAAFARPETRVLAVVDPDGRLVGVLPVLRVVEELMARAAPEQLMAEVFDLESAARFGREVGAHVAQDLMSRPIALSGDATVADAFRTMKEHRYSGLPVVDAERRVVGYIDLLELGLRYLEELSGDPDERE